MSYAILVFAFFFYLSYLGLKFLAYQNLFSKEPNFKELWEYDFENNPQRGRNAKSFRLIAILFAMFGLIAIPIEFRYRIHSDAATVLKVLMLSFFSVNFVARSIIFKRNNVPEEELAPPILQVLKTIRKTGWMVKGKDLVSLIANLTTAGVLIIAFVWFYQLFEI